MSDQPLLDTKRASMPRKPVTRITDEPQKAEGRPDGCSLLSQDEVAAAAVNIARGATTTLDTVSPWIEPLPVQKLLGELLRLRPTPSTSETSEELPAQPDEQAS